jgi:hypothetical protein
MGIPMQVQLNTGAETKKKTGKLRWVFWVGFAVSVVLMTAASRGDLALDEVISLQKAEGAKSWLEIVTQDQNDNNHLLNTFFLHLLGRQQNLFVYRMPAVMFGIATIAALALTARRWGKEESVWAVYLAGWSCPMILYCSEARGYAPAMFFAVMAFELLQRCWERCTPARLLLFWSSLCLGFLSHFSFGLVCIALGIWSLIHEQTTGASWRGLGVKTVKYYAVPAIFIVGIYLVYIRHMKILGGYIYTRWQVMGDVAASVLGFLDVAELYWVAVPLAVVLIGCGILALVRRRRDEWLFMVLLLLVLPSLAVALHPKIICLRYFMVCLPFLYLLLAILFAGWFRDSGKIMKQVPVWLTLAMTAGHLVKVANLLEWGRGNYRRALQDMAAATAGPLVRVGSDNDFRNGRLLNFYARYLPPSKWLEYIPQTERHQERPEWMIVCCLNPTFAAYPDLEVGRVGKYSLFGVYPYAGLTGWSWFVYQRPAATGDGPPDDLHKSGGSVSAAERPLP